MSSTIWTDDYRWTDDQRKAIYTRGTDLLVAAAAGAGKTAVLAERAVRIVLDERRSVDIDRLLIVTFTQAAAGEMRQRISEALAKALQRQPANAHLERQVFLLPRACIDTLHSFCSEVVRRHFYLLDLDPGFRVMDEAETEMLRREVLSTVIEEAYERCEVIGPEPPFLRLTRALSGRHGDERQLEDLVLRLYDYAYSLPRPRTWLRWTVDVLSGAPDKPWEQQPWIGEWRDSVRLVLEDAREKIGIALRLASETEGLEKYVDTLMEDQGTVNRLLSAADGPCDALREAVEREVSWRSLPRIRQTGSTDRVKDRIKTLRDRVKTGVNDLKKNWLGRPAIAMLKDLALAAPLVQALTDLTLRFDDAYRQTKSNRAVADFADLEHYALAILADNAELSPWGKDIPADPDAALSPSPVALEYRAHFAEVLVDEYQDINGIQEAILGLVTPQGSRFMVGDVKQSIYRFRRADPQVFLDRYERYSELEGLDNGACTGQGRRLDLTENFRSRPEVLKTVNYLFRNLMTRRVGELDYDERACLRPGFKYPVVESGRAGGRVEFHLLECTGPVGNGGAGGDRGGYGGADDDGSGMECGAPSPSSGYLRQSSKEAGKESENEESGDGESEGMRSVSLYPGLRVEDLDAARLEARWVAKRVWRLVKEEHHLVFNRSLSKYRPVTWRDVVVLMRSLRGRVSVFLEEFQRAGIPAYADGSGGYFTTPEVETMLSLLRLIDNPRQDIPLAAVLRSPLVGLNASDLAKIRVATRQGPFYCAVERAATGEADLENGLAERIQEFWRRLGAWRDLARFLPPAELLEEIYRQTGYYDLAGGMPGGEGRQANLRALVDRARQFAGTIYRGLFHFLRYVERMQDEGGDMDTARSLGENEDVVRILSIHRSKGLEFPVVIVSGLGCRFNLRDLTGDFLFHRRLGCGPKVYDLERGVIYPTVLHHLVKKRLRLEDLSEEMRLLYVALTRARERLVVTGAVKDLWMTVDKWRNLADELPEDGPLGAAYSAEATSPLDWLGPVLLKHPEAGEVGRAPEVLDAETGHWELHLWPSTRLVGLYGTDAGAFEVRSAEEDFGTEDSPIEGHAGIHALTHASSAGMERSLRTLSVCPEEWIRDEEKKWEENVQRGEGNVQRNVDVISPYSAKDTAAGTDVAELRARLFWTNPHQPLAGLPSKITVTEWRHRLEMTIAEEEEEEVEVKEAVLFGKRRPPDNDPVHIDRGLAVAKEMQGADDLQTEAGSGLGGLPPGFELPSFVEGRRYGGTERGRAVHLVMAKIDLTGAVDAAEIRQKVRDLVNRGVLPPDQAKLVRVLDIVRFLRSDLGQRVMRAARQRALWREVPFTAGFSVTELYPELAGRVPENEIIVVQGIIDCLLVSEGGLVLIDYKTDRVSPDDISGAIDKYRIQLELYARAIERTLCRPVTEKCLYFFSLGRGVAVE